MQSLTSRFDFVNKHKDLEWNLEILRAEQCSKAVATSQSTIFLAVASILATKPVPASQKAK